MYFWIGVGFLYRHSFRLSSRMGSSCLQSEKFSMGCDFGTPETCTLILSYNSKFIPLVRLQSAKTRRSYCSSRLAILGSAIGGGPRGAL